MQMSGVSFPVSRPGGRVLVVGTPAHCGEAAKLLCQQGYDCDYVDDPYVAMLKLCRHRLAFQDVILSLASLYHEELNIIATIKRRLPHVEIWLAQTDGRAASLAEGMRLGADGLLAEDGTLHRIGNGSPEPATNGVPHPMAGGTEISGEHVTRVDAPTTPGTADPFDIEDDLAMGEPVLTADELRALLQDQPSMPPSSVNDER